MIFVQHLIVFFFFFENVFVCKCICKYATDFNRIVDYINGLIYTL